MRDVTAWLFSDGGRLLLHGLVGSDLAVADENDAVRMLRDIVLVRNQNNRISLPVQILEEPHDLVARF